jgi:hypothetical protein
MEFVLVAAVAIAGVVVAVTWIPTGNPTLALIAATTASISVLAIGDARRRSERRH